MQKAAVEDLLRKVVKLVRVFELVVRDEGRIDEAEAAVEGQRREFGELAKDLGPLVLNMVLLDVKDCLGLWSKRIVEVLLGRVVLL